MKRNNKSEIKSKCNLYTPRIARAGDLTEGTRPERGADATPVGVVERVEELSTQGQVSVLPDGKLLRERRVENHETRSANRTHTCIAINPGAGAEKPQC